MSIEPIYNQKFKRRSPDFKDNKEKGFVVQIDTETETLIEQYQPTETAIERLNSELDELTKEMRHCMLLVEISMGNGSFEASIGVRTSESISKLNEWLCENSKFKPLVRTPAFAKLEKRLEDADKEVCYAKSEHEKRMRKFERPEEPQKLILTPMDENNEYGHEDEEAQEDDPDFDQLANESARELLKRQSDCVVSHSPSGLKKETASFRQAACNMLSSATERAREIINDYWESREDGHFSAKDAETYDMLEGVLADTLRHYEEYLEKARGGPKEDDDDFESDAYIIIGSIFKLMKKLAQEIQDPETSAERRGDLRIQFIENDGYMDQLIEESNRRVPKDSEYFFDLVSQYQSFMVEHAESALRTVVADEDHTEKIEELIVAGKLAHGIVQVNTSEDNRTNLFYVYTASMNPGAPVPHRYLVDIFVLCDNLEGAQVAAQGFIRAIERGSRSGEGYVSVFITEGPVRFAPPDEGSNPDDSYTFLDVENLVELRPL